MEGAVFVTQIMKSEYLVSPNQESNEFRFVVRVDEMLLGQALLLVVVDAFSFKDSIGEMCQGQ